MRFDISSKNLNGEGSLIDPQFVTSELKKLNSILATYDPRDVYNLDETALFYKQAPNK